MSVFIITTTVLQYSGDILLLLYNNKNEHMFLGNTMFALCLWDRAQQYDVSHKSRHPCECDAKYLVNSSNFK